MSLKSIIITMVTSLMSTALLLLFATYHFGCNKGNPSGGDDTTKVVDTNDINKNLDTVGLSAYGTFLISLREDSVTTRRGRMDDGPQPSKIIWEVMESRG
ncbi:MAG: hypothetical protein N2053_09070, partial [Chitinispirillaceae bacterium]|nr:hypothetical protein [Chitinispirillaceae bacterium]